MICTSSAVFVWMGKFNSEMNSSRWLKERKLAMQTALNFATCKESSAVFDVTYIMVISYRLWYEKLCICG